MVKKAGKKSTKKVSAKKTEKTKKNSMPKLEKKWEVIATNSPLEVNTLVKNKLLKTITFPRTMPVVPIKDIVPYPSVTISLQFMQSASNDELIKVCEQEKLIFMTSQMDSNISDPDINDVYKFGVIAQVLKAFHATDGRHKLLVQGIVRAKIKSGGKKQDYISASVIPAEGVNNNKLKSTDTKNIKEIKLVLQQMVEQEYLPEEIALVVDDIKDIGVLSDILMTNFKQDPVYSQKILEEVNESKRLSLVTQVVKDEYYRLALSADVQKQAFEEMSKGQQEFFLREQMKVIQRELGVEDSSVDELTDLKKSLQKAKLPKQADAEAKRQFSRLEKMSSESSEYALLRTYLEWIADLPWSVTTKDMIDLKVAEDILDEDHYGLDKPKQRIIEYLSVRKLRDQSKGPILCLVGPPGVGKTSLGKSVAKALNRTFFRMSLGGVRDEAEIRGHRRTYVGALPGRIIQGLKQAGSKNPVFVLDELDKIGADFRGDPSSALLEVLDPQQNKNFQDHYLNLDFDLSEVLFFATANTIDTIPDALLDRLEVIHISGYTTEEKLNIAKKYLIPKQIEENGITKLDVEISDPAILLLIERYTLESGVRNLEREIGSLCRKIAREYAEYGKAFKKITPQIVKKLLGNTKFDPESREHEDSVGYVNGLAWTIYGGEVMPIEASIAEGGNKLTLTGQLGEVMQESAQAALFYARANAKELGLMKDFNDKYDIHLHVPAGATPKDGPSAGVAICAVLISILSNRKISHDFAMTGEITLRGNVLAVGGIKDKVLAAIREGIQKIIIPHDNIKDLDEVSADMRKKVEFIPVRHISEVLKLVFVDDKKKKAPAKKKKTAQKKKNVPQKRKNTRKSIGARI